ncbi:hypothetical protein H9Q69_010324 [Fusarium xylarioides]|uniref:DNA2/NAM7 helicase helicase domain-containing protein n=1 Tax=Fusarium xylarioides TaxID=221167 RepID=A0A9P7HVV4_9HYPO|nr:hypothetical protein H9Q70_005227 [Fusarium xylarioides]KAG5762833.1 hypothetical protein H9Q72_009058 [Fusarium xylarioides]KAG5790626.1 hypothetical protein H9Q69_010324 [Fusarium xylarioides]
MYTMPDASIVMGECDAITLMNSRAHASTLTLAARFWNYSHNFHEMFPGLARAYKEGEFDDEVARLVETLQDAPAGHASCTGGPGSGKTTTVLNIVKAILSGAVEKVDISDPDAKEGEAMVSGHRLPRMTGNLLNLPPVMRCPAKGALPTDNCTTIWVHNDNAVELFGTDLNHFSGVKLLASNLPSTEVNYEDQVMQSLAHIEGLVSVPALDGYEETSAPFTEYEEPKLGEYKQAEGFMSAKDIDGGSFDQSSSKPRVAWTAAQNKVVDDAAHRAFLLRFAR